MNRRVYPPGYSKILPESNYAPWEVDSDFASIYRRIADHTMVDQYRCYSLYQLLRQVLTVSGDILEVGVWQGGTGALLAHGACVHTAGVTPCTICLADTFTGVAKAGVHDPYYKGGEHANTSSETVVSLLESLDVHNYKILSGVFPEQTGGCIADRQFRFCHIDVDVYQSAKDTFEWVWPRLQPGGIVVFDDYGFYGCEGVTKMVNDTKDALDRVFIHNINGQAIMIKRG